MCNCKEYFKYLEKRGIEEKIAINPPIPPF